MIGCLDADGNLDSKAMEPLLKAAEGTGLTLHRCIDVSHDPVETYLTAGTAGIDTVLTSGGAGNCIKDLSDIGCAFSYYCTLVNALSMHQQYENERRLLAWAKAQRGYAFFAFIPTLVGGAVTIAHLIDEATALKDIEEWEKRQGE